MLHDCVLGGGFQGSRILPSERLPELLLPSCWDAPFWCLGLLATGRSRQGAAVQWRLYRCRQRASASRRTEGQSAGPTSDLSGGLLLRLQRVVAPHSAKGRPLPSCLEVAAHQNQKGGRRTTAPHFHRIELWWCQFLFLRIFICSHDFSFWRVFLICFLPFVVFDMCFLFLFIQRTCCRSADLLVFPLFVNVTTTCCFRHSVRFCVRCSIVVPKTLSYVQIRRTSAPLHI